MALSVFYGKFRIVLVVGWSLAVRGGVCMADGGIFVSWCCLVEDAAAVCCGIGTTLAVWHCVPGRGDFRCA